MGNKVCGSGEPGSVLEVEHEASAGEEDDVVR